MLAKEPNPNRWRFARDVRVFAARDGLIISTLRGCFRLSGSSAASFLWEVLPALYCAEADSIDESAAEWLNALGEHLKQAGIVEVTVKSNALHVVPDHEACVTVSRRTPVAMRALDHLVEFGFQRAKSVCENQFIIADLCELDINASLLVAQMIYRSGCRSVSLWRQGAETFYGPIAEPKATACWYCCRRRFADSLSSSDLGAAEDEEATAKVIAENVLLAIRYPDIAGYGCVLADDGETTSLHSVLPMPWCSVCGGVIDPSRLTALTNSVHVPKDLRILADTRGGIVRKLLIFESHGGDTPAVPECCSVAIASFQSEEFANPGFNGEGKGVTREDALRSAIGEGVERYAASLWHPSDLTFGSFAALADRAFDPNWLVLYDESQYAREGFVYRRFDPEQPLHWIVGQWLDTLEQVKIPAYATYLNFTVVAEQFSQTTSSGLATGGSFEDAALGALYELIERDAFMLSWLAQRPGLRIDTTGCEEATSRALREVERLGATAETVLIDVGTGHPTVVCLGFGDGVSWPGVTIGLGTHADIDIALRKAVLEHSHYGAYMRRLMQEGRHHYVRQCSDVLGSLDHGLFYVHPEHAVELEFFWRGKEPAVALDALRSQFREPATLSACITRLRKAGVRTAAVDVTSSDVALAGLRVVRAFGVNLQPIHFGFGYERLKNPRLQALLFDSAVKTPHPVA